ncbi:hypothetical protein OIE78_35405 (plasmid) [Streptomyces cellulosae]|uniref:hypothetical protein n=1 Tax=Streptomyces cellulosae TaxID=1968 RepID=UPI002F91BE49|nr:hypothetical protein OG837_34815 [Streptomyces cellulosae]
MISNILEAPLAPVADLDDAEEAVRPVARSMVRLLGVTVRAQFPDAAYLVLQRSTEDEEVYLVAVRNAEGMDLWDFPTDTPACYRPFPSPVPPELAELWGDLDPQRPDSIESLAQRIDAVLGIDVVPKSAMHPGEEKMERTPLGIPLLDAEVPEWPITWPRFVATVERLRAEGRALARLIADTLNRQFDGAAAYLVLEESDSRDFMGMQSIHDGDGGTLFEFGDDDASLPALPDDSPLAAAWGHMDPAHPWTPSRAIQQLYRLGFTFDWTPDHLPSDDAPSEEQCLLLSPAARPSWWGLIDEESETLLRPYSAPCPHS